MRSKRPLASILVFSCLALYGCKEQILHNLSEGDANKIIAELSEISLDGEKINGEKVKQPDGKWSVAVSTSNVPNALAHLKRARLLRDEPKSAESSSLIASREDQQFRHERNLSREIERSLTAIDGVLEARVHLNLPPRDPIFGQKAAGAKGTASLLLVTNGDAPVTKEEFAALVGGAAGIEIEDVRVLISNEARSPTLKSKDETSKESLLPFRDLIAIITFALLLIGALLIYLTSHRWRDLERNSLRKKVRSNEEMMLSEALK